MGRSKPSRQKRPRSNPHDGPPRLNIDMSLMKRAASSLSIMTPGRMPLLMDAMSAKQKAIFDFYQGMLNRAERDGYGSPLDRSLAHIAQGVHFDSIVMGPSGRYGPDANQAALDVATLYLLSAEVGHKSIVGRYAYFATEEMSALVLAGAETVEAFALTQSDLPSPNGFAYLYRPDGEALLLWWMTVGELGVAASLVPAGTIESWLKDTDVVQHPHLFSSAVLSPVGSEGAPRRVQIANPFEGLLEAPGESIKFNADRALPVLFSFAHMIRQDVVELTLHQTPPVPTNRKGLASRRGERITYLSLKRSASHGESHGTSGRQYSSRWVVRGFWRRQWYPSLKRHYPIWIMDHIAGPADAPLVVRDKVMVVKPPAPSP